MSRLVVLIAENSENCCPQCNYFLHELSFKLNKKLLLKILQYSQENIPVFIKKRFQHSSFPVHIAKYFGTTILKNGCERLLLRLTLGSNPRVSH